MSKDSPFYKQGTTIKTIRVGDNVHLDDDSYINFGNGSTLNLIRYNTNSGNFEIQIDENYSNGVFAIRNTDSSVNYNFGNGGADFDRHLDVRAGLGFIEQLVDHVTVGSTISLYSKAVSGITQLFSRSSDGFITQLTGTGALENTWDRSGINLRPHTSGDSVSLGNLSDFTIPYASRATGQLNILDNGNDLRVVIDSDNGEGIGYAASLLINGDGGGGGDSSIVLKNNSINNLSVSTNGTFSVIYSVFSDALGIGLDADFQTISQAGTDDSGSFNFNTGATVNGNSGDISLTTGAVSGAGIRGDINLTANNINFSPSGTTTLTLLANQSFIVDRDPSQIITPVTDANKVVEYISDGNATNFWFNAPTSAQGGTNTTFGFAENGNITSALTYHIDPVLGYIALTNDGANGTPTTGVIVLNNGEVTINTNSNADFANSQLFVTRSDTGATSSAEIGIVGEAAATTIVAFGIAGYGKTSSTDSATGVVGRGLVNASGDAVSCVGGDFSALDTHAGGANIGITVAAINGAENYSLFNVTGGAIYHIGGGVSLPFRTETGASYTAGYNDHTILCNSATITINLPDATLVPTYGFILNIKNIHATGVVTIDANGAETIDGAATQVLNTQYESLTIQSNGSAWFIL